VNSIAHFMLRTHTHTHTHTLSLAQLPIMTVAVIAYLLSGHVNLHPPKITVSHGL